MSDEPLPPLDTIEAATRLLEQGRAFSAHEVFEARWKTAPPVERDLWQGLAQLCVGITHAMRGNEEGARRLTDRGAGHLRDYALSDGPRYGLDLDEWVDRAQAAVATATPTER